MGNGNGGQIISASGFRQSSKYKTFESFSHSVFVILWLNITRAIIIRVSTTITFQKIYFRNNFTPKWLVVIVQVFRPRHSLRALCAFNLSRFFVHVQHNNK